MLKRTRVLLIIPLIGVVAWVVSTTMGSSPPIDVPSTQPTIAESIRKPTGAEQPKIPLLIANPPSAKVAYIGNEVVQFNHIHYDTARIPVSPEEAELLAELNTAKECTTWPHAKTEAEMREALKDLDQELAKRGQPFGTEVTRQANWERFRRCKDITQETLDEITAKVSQSDNPEMLYDYALAVMKEKPEVARVILEKEWNRTGSILTLGELSQVGTPLAYKMAYMAAMIAMQHDNFKPLLEETMNSTSLSELSEATQQAAQILRSPICCAYP